VIVNIVESLVPLRQRFDVDGANTTMTAAPQLGDEMAADEPARTRYENKIALFHVD
jgi:hypothetical protein